VRRDAALKTLCILESPAKPLGDPQVRHAPVGLSKTLVFESVSGGAFFLQTV
jgi:hypothetical protein